MTEYLEPRRSVSFGDIFDLEFLYDVHVRADAVALGARDLAARFGGGKAYASVYPGAEWVLARGQLGLGILIADNCLIDTALGQDREETVTPKGRLLFAPLSQISPNELPIRTFGRFGLPAWDGVWEAATAELRRCFMVDARDIADNRDARKASLGDDLAEELEIRWSAYAARRGPLSSGRNCEKLAEVLMREFGDASVRVEDKEIAFVVATTLAVAWRLEGRDLEAVSDAHAAGEGGLGEAEAVREGLLVLASAAEDAAQMLSKRLSGEAA